MRRPHVYERSAPRANRGAPSATAAAPQASSRHLTRLISNAILEAEALGRADVVEMLDVAAQVAGRSGSAEKDGPEAP